MSKIICFHPRLGFGKPLQMIFLLFLVAICPSQSVSAQDKGTMLRTLTVTGHGVETIPTTLSQVNLGVAVQAKTAQEAQQQVARRAAAVVNLLKSRNVEKLQTTGINLNPVYSYNNNTQRITGYSATNSVSFRIPTAQTGTLLDEAVKAGASQIDSISFVASDEAIAQAQKQALKEATQEAQQQAEAIFNSLGLQSKEIVSIQVNDAKTPPPIPFLRAEGIAKQAAADVSTPVVASEQQVEAAVTLQIRY